MHWYEAYWRELPVSEQALFQKYHCYRKLSDLRDMIWSQKIFKGWRCSGGFQLNFTLSLRRAGSRWRWSVSLGSLLVHYLFAGPWRTRAKPSVQQTAVEPRPLTAPWKQHSHSFVSLWWNSSEYMTVLVVCRRGTTVYRLRPQIILLLSSLVHLWNPVLDMVKSGTRNLFNMQYMVKNGTKYL